MLRGKLPYRHAATRWRGGGPFRLAVVQNLVFGQEFFDALTAGSVPVYRGAPEVAELAPAPGCYIDAADFASPAALAAHLDRLSGDDAAYAGYHAWRAGGFSAAFRAHLRRLGWPPFARLAERVRAWIAAGRPAAHRPE